MTKPHADECRRRKDDLMQRDEDALVQRRQSQEGLDGLMRERLLRRRNLLGQISRQGAAENPQPKLRGRQNPRGRRRETSTWAQTNLRCEG